MMKNHWFFCLIAVTGGWWSCTKSATVTDDAFIVGDGSDVRLEVLSPYNEGVYFHGDTIHIHVLSSSPQELHGYSIRMANLNTGELLVNQYAHIHETALDLRHYWVNTVTELTTLVLRVEIVFAHTSNGRITEDLTLTCVPNSD
jgi:hypothetical protein